jgi:hypothetical protein
MMGRRVVILGSVAVLILAGCEGGDGYSYSYYDDPFYDPWDYGFRYGIYDVHDDYNVDIDVDRPIRDGARPDRPLPPPSARPPRSSRPVSGMSRPSQPAGGRGGRSLR